MGALQERKNVKIVAFIQMFNEVTKGNLERCLINCQQWADEIVIYDDASTDNSVEVAERYTKHIIRGEVNNFFEELAHKQRLLELALTLWVDCDEILDRTGTLGGLRLLAEKGLKVDVDAYSFHETNFWRSETYYRTDTLFDKGWFVRLWKVVPGMSLLVENGLHKVLHPQNIREENIIKSGIRVLHYGFADYDYCLKHIGAIPEHGWDKSTFRKLAPDNWILNETKCLCHRVPVEWYPEENIPEDRWDKPKPRTIASLKSQEELAEE